MFSASPLPTLQELENSTVTVEEAVNTLKVTGGVIIRNFLAVVEIDRIMKDVRPYLDADQSWDG